MSGNRKEIYHNLKRYYLTNLIKKKFRRIGSYEGHKIAQSPLIDWAINSFIEYLNNQYTHPRFRHQL